MAIKVGAASHETDFRIVLRFEGKPARFYKARVPDPGIIRGLPWRSQSAVTVVPFFGQVTRC